MFYSYAGEHLSARAPFIALSPETPLEMEDATDREAVDGAVAVLREIFTRGKGVKFPTPSTRNARGGVRTSSREGRIATSAPEAPERITTPPPSPWVSGSSSRGRPPTGNTLRRCTARFSAGRGRRRACTPR